MLARDSNDQFPIGTLSRKEHIESEWLVAGVSYDGRWEETLSITVGAVLDDAAEFFLVVARDALRPKNGASYVVRGGVPLPPDIPIASIHTGRFRRLLQQPLMLRGAGQRSIVLGHEVTFSILAVRQKSHLPRGHRWLR
jgi:hypothetical protein